MWCLGPPRDASGLQNALQGALPESWFSPPDLTFLNLSSNNLTGEAAWLLQKSAAVVLQGNGRHDPTCNVRGMLHTSPTNSFCCHLALPVCACVCVQARCTPPWLMAPLVLAASPPTSPVWI